MIVVTGGAGFIGSNLVKKLNLMGFDNILVVDDLTDGTKFANLVDCNILDYMDKDVFLHKIIAEEFFSEAIEVIFHQGACSNTTEWNGKYVMENNYECSKILLHYCANNYIPFIYASSASVYGDNKIFQENIQNEKPLNVYGYSKFLFDQYVRRNLTQFKNQIVGLRYFNVYGPREQHKNKMASVAYHLNNQLQQNGKIKLFVGSDGFANGEQRRDFIYVDDVVEVILWFWTNKDKTGIFNLGTGQSASFNDVANAIISYYGKGEIEYIPFPKELEGRYQSYTQADMSELLALGCPIQFKPVNVGVKLYMDCLNNRDGL